MKKGQKILIALGLLAAAGTGYLLLNKKSDTPADEAGAAPPEGNNNAPDNKKTGRDFVAPKPPANNVISPFALADFDVIVSPSNRALVTKMQKMLGITADGVWGIQTAAALGRYGLVNGFTLRTLQTKMQSTPKWLRGFNGGLLGI